MPNENNSSAPLKTAGVSLAEHRANRVYVAGPMTGLPELNFPEFNAAASELRAEGWHVENPAEHGILDGAQWSDYMHTDLQQLSTCCAIYLLPGWSKSRGATLEAHVALALGMAVYYAPNAETQTMAAQAPAAVHTKLSADADLWYLQDTRSYVGNDVLWWAKDGNGYTTDISKAHAYTRDEAFCQAAMRGTDRAWPKAYIDGKTRPAVDMQYIDHQAAMAAAQEGGKA